MLDLRFWVPIFQQDLSTDAKLIIRMCQREPKPILISEVMRLYRKEITPLTFIDRWQHLFSTETREKMRKMRRRIDIDARKQSILFVARLKNMVMQNRKNEHAEANSRVATESVIHTVPRRRRSSVRPHLTDDYIDNPQRAFITSFRRYALERTR